MYSYVQLCTLLCTLSQFSTNNNNMESRMKFQVKSKKSIHFLGIKMLSVYGSFSWFELVLMR